MSGTWCINVFVWIHFGFMHWKISVSPTLKTMWGCMALCLFGFKWICVIFQQNCLYKRTLYRNFCGWFSGDPNIFSCIDMNDVKPIQSFKELSCLSFLCNHITDSAFGTRWTSCMHDEWWNSNYSLLFYTISLLLY